MNQSKKGGGGGTESGGVDWCNKAAVKGFGLKLTETTRLM